MKKFLFLLVLTLFLTPNIIYAASDISQKDFDLAKKNGDSNGLAYDETYSVYYFKDEGEYRLTSDVNIADGIVVNEVDTEIILDLNGKTILFNVKEDDMRWFISIYDSKVTFKGKGKITSNAKMKYLLVGTEGSNVIIDGPTFEGRIASSGEDNEDKPGAIEQLYIKSGNIGSLSAVQAKITIDDANFNANFLERETIYVDADVDLVINGGTFESNYGTIRSFTLPEDYNTTTITINGGTFIGKERFGLSFEGHEKVEINAGVFKDDSETITITSDNKKDANKVKAIGTVTGTIKVTKGNDSKYTKEVDEELSFTIEKEYEYFVYEEVFYGNIYVDDKKLDENDFTISGNTTVTLKKSYLDTLSRGKHTIKIVSYYGEFATATFMVTTKVSIVVYITIICAAILAGALFIKKKCCKVKNSK